MGAPHLRWRRRDQSLPERHLQRGGIQAARGTVARLMRERGLRGAIRGKPVKTTIADKALPCPLDRVNRQFRADRPDQLWLSDFTPDQVRGRLHVCTWSGFVYFAPDALEQAPHQRRPGSLDWLTIPTGPANICPPDTPSGWVWPASNHRSAASASVLGRNRQWHLQGGTHPQAKAMEIL